MKIFAVSDLHLDHRRNDRKAQVLIDSLPDANVAIVAGDIGTQRTVIKALEMLGQRYPDVVYVAGNHDYWHGSVDQFCDLMKGRPENVHWLYNSAVTIGGQRFIGATLWFPYTESVSRLRHGWPDFEFISDFPRFFAHEHMLTRDYLAENVKPSDIVVTHHLPDPLSIHGKYATDKTNCFYLGDCTDIIDSNRPRAWVHGHTHEACDYTIGDTRIVCNPSGYPGEGKTVGEVFL